MVFDVVKELSRNLNFTYTIQVLSENKAIVNGSNLLEFVDLVTNKIPDTIIQAVKSKSVAMAACGFTVTSKAKTLVNFTIPISTQSYSFIVARPRELSRALLFMSPFTVNVSFTNRLKDLFSKTAGIISGLVVYSCSVDHNGPNTLLYSHIKPSVWI